MVQYARGGSAGASGSYSVWSDMGCEHTGCSGSTRAATRPGPCSAAAEDGGEPLLPAGALDHDLDAVARLVAAHRLADVRGGADAAAVDADDDVAGLHAGQVRAAARLHPLHEGTCRGGDPEAVDD